ncbi:hypothetical protein FHR84_002175 [Actinopolyspora biskrensis]|uniref:PRC-barrel domain-containing protein n=1 Tax=Actinopolyspora biskrensis TaxID=1470178 RepID=A0A852YXW0_9ACTN|nr:PRC-barrel domain containing protein [Actinopolyspora biskrensis]NYH78850.1 hypothetical protein [Actinopolyspora biskrensis]
MIGQREALRLAGCDTFDPRGHRLGVIGRILVDADTEQPVWATVQTGLFGTNESLVPLEGAAFDGDTLTVAVARESVRNAPCVPLSEGDLEAEQERELYLHYGMERGARPRAPEPAVGDTAGSAETVVSYVRAVRSRLRRLVVSP